MRKLTTTLLLLIGFAAGLAALQPMPTASPQGQPPPSTQPPPPSQPPATLSPQTAPPGTPRPSTTPPAAPTGQQGRGQPPGAAFQQTTRTGFGESKQNIKIDITFADTLAGDTPVRKTMTVLVAENRGGKIRSTGLHQGVINIDAMPSMAGDRILLHLTIEYMPDLTAQGQPPQNSSRIGMLTQSLSVLIENGKPTVVTQSADPTSARRVTVEVTATIIK